MSKVQTAALSNLWSPQESVADAIGVDIRTSDESEDVDVAGYGALVKPSTSAGGIQQQDFAIGRAYESVVDTVCVVGESGDHAGQVDARRGCAGEESSGGIRAVKDRDFAVGRPYEPVQDKICV